MAQTQRPGARAQRFSARVLDPDTYDRVIVPALADVEHECRGGTSGGARPLVHLRAHWGLWKAIVVCVLTDAARRSRPSATNILARFAYTLPITTAVVLMPAVGVALGRETGIGAATFLLMQVPQALAVSLPLAFFFSVAMEHDTTRPVYELPGVLALSCACAIAMLAITLEVIPRTNHAYAVAVHDNLRRTPGDDLTRPTFGSSEWTTADLISADTTRDPAAHRALAARLTLCTLPLMLGVVALGVGRGKWQGETLFRGLWLAMIYVAALRAVTPSAATGPTLSGVLWVHGVFAAAGIAVAIWRSRPVLTLER